MGCIPNSGTLESPITSILLQNNTLLLKNKQNNRKIEQVKIQEKLPQNIIKCDRQIEDNQFLKKLMQQHVFFFNLSNALKEEILQNVIIWCCQAQIEIFKEQQRPKGFFIIKQGIVQCKFKGNLIKILKKGDYFGQISLIHASFQNKSVFSISKSKLFFINELLFKKTIESNIKYYYQIIKQSIQKISTLAYLNDYQKLMIVYSVKLTKFLKQQTLLNSNHSIFKIIKGNIEIYYKQNSNVILGPNQSFGSLSLLKEQENIIQAIAKTDAFCFILEKQSIKKILGSNLSQIIYNNVTKWLLKHSLLFTKLQNSQLDQILRNRNYISYNNGEIILKQNQNANKIIVCLQGKINDIAGPSIIGEQYFTQNKNFLYKQSYYKNGQGVVTIINKQELQNLCHKKVRFTNKKKHQSQFKSNKDFNRLELDKFIYIKKLGEGQFGTVYLVKQSSVSSNLYAMKCIKKSFIIQNHLQKMVMEEKYTLSLLNFPFIMNFYKSFQDNNYIYLLTEFIEGLDLFQVIRQVGILSKEITLFYLSSLILIVEYLFSKNIIHRDLKPQNILVQLNGYIKLVDMGSAKQLKQISGFRTYTVIGTPHYMAPEIMLGKSYTVYADLWSLGIILYEFLCGQLPFAQDEDDPLKIHKQILNNQVKYPDFVSDNKAKSLMNQLLNKNSEKRLDKGFTVLKNHPYLENFAWEELENKSMKASYNPKLNEKIEITQKQCILFVEVINNQKQKQDIQRKSRIMNWDAYF